MNILRGMVIGVANIIPGVSGGTLALVLGIYERLIGAINNISFETVKASFGLLKFNKDGWKNFTAELHRIDAFFLASILTGALISIGALAKVMTYFLEHFHDPTYGFFCGLVIVSAWVPFKLIKKHSFFSTLAVIIRYCGSNRFLFSGNR
jgi:putative membrane protein